MKTAMITGASGFLGNHLLHELLNQGVYVHVISRPSSKRLSRLNGLKNTNIIELDMDDILRLEELMPLQCDVFYHLAWQGGRNDFTTQIPNIKRTMDALEIAYALGCKRFVCTGSQAEYGIHHGLITENTTTNPNTAYGAAKLATCNLSRVRAEQLGIEWIWARVFSVYGPGDNPNSLIPYLLHTLINGQIPSLTQGNHKWDYLYVTDAAKALSVLGNTPHTNQIYNVARGESFPLRWYVERLRDIVAPGSPLGFGLAEGLVVPLEASVEKLKEKTGWQVQVGFDSGVMNTFDYYNNSTFAETKQLNYDN
ncbi:MAG: UDP-N-acetylglucosamine 4-epimerase [Firmicutes bacterium]|nr:UDP-N-acetylglucosamine 4-epimerase [Bacillota bacterium]